MAHVAAWQRDADRLLELLNRTNRMPLGKLTKRVNVNVNVDVFVDVDVVFLRVSL